MQIVQILYRVSVMFVVTCFWVVVVKNGWGLLRNSAIKSAIKSAYLKNGFMNLANFLHADTNLGKVNVNSET